MRASQGARRLQTALRPCWWAALLTLLASLALLHPQAVDAVGSLARDEGVPWWTQASLFAAVLACSVASWYFPRALLYVRYWNTPARSEDSLEIWRRRVPRVLGATPLFLLTCAAWRAGAGLYALAGAVLTVVFWLFVVYRRALFRLSERTITLHPRMPTTTYRVMLVFFAISSSLFLLFLVSPVRTPQAIGPLGILFMATAALIAVGSVVLIYPTYRFRLPPLILLAVGVTWLFGLWNENHQVRTLSTSEEWVRPGVHEHLDAWLEARRPALEAGAAPYPVFVVAAEGGGIRAAYWTAALLAHLAEEYPQFPCHLFAISGVSGGALGGAVFTALAADWAESCGAQCDGGDHGADGGHWACALTVLSKDFLGPALAGMLFPDFVQRLWPLSGVAAFPDRAFYLERAWEVAWNDLEQDAPYRRSLGSDPFRRRFQSAFRDLWSSPDARHHVPSLFLNGTWVDSGSRNLTSNLRPEPPHFVQLEEVLPRVESSIPLSTAVHMSARFTYLSPAGVIGSGPERRRIVDGGYFENSGALTAAEIVAVLAEHSAQHPEFDIVPIALTFSASPPPSRPTRLAIMKETLAPIHALFKAREARGHHAEDFLATRVLEHHSLRFELPRQGEESVPLGWMLSDAMRAHIEESVRNSPKVAEMKRWLRPAD